jgi:two-component system, NarL family, response regulator DegU
MKQTRLLLITPNFILREGLVNLFRQLPGFEVSNSSGDKKSVLIKTSQLKPHIILFDIAIKSSDSTFLIKILREQFCDIKIVIFGVAPGEDRILDYVRQGVSGFIIRDASFDIFRETVERIALGMTVLPPSLSDFLFSEIERHASAHGTKNYDVSFDITFREEEIIRLLKEGMTNKEIASELQISLHTVKSHIHHILNKLGLHSRMQIAASETMKVSSSLKSN